MRYHGGKTRVGKCISKIIQGILNVSPNDIDGYIEPFCGMCGVLVHVVRNSNLQSYHASDNNNSVIIMWEKLRQGWKPDINKFNEKRFSELKGDGKSSAEKGFFGHAVTFGALYFQCYRPELTKLLNYSYNDVRKRSVILSDVVFKTCDYRSILEENPTRKLIYCDPPYERRSRYYDEFNKQLVFDSDDFWETCESLSLNNIVVISEQKKFFDYRYHKYTGKIHVIKLPSKQNRFGSTKRESGEYLGVMTHLDICLDNVCLI